MILTSGEYAEVWLASSYAYDKEDYSDMYDHMTYEHQSNTPDLSKVSDSILYYVPSRIVSKEEYMGHVEGELCPEFEKDMLEWGDWDSPVRLEMKTEHYPKLLMSQSIII